MESISELERATLRQHWASQTDSVLNQSQEDQGCNKNTHTSNEASPGNHSGVAPILKMAFVVVVGEIIKELEDTYESALQDKLELGSQKASSACVGIYKKHT